MRPISDQIALTYAAPRPIPLSVKTSARRDTSHAMPSSVSKPIRSCWDSARLNASRKRFLNMGFASASKSRWLLSRSDNLILSEMFTFETSISWYRCFDSRSRAEGMSANLSSMSIPSGGISIPSSPWTWLGTSAPDSLSLYQNETSLRANWTACR
ncbi:unnamed protein product [Mycena citricolor]|uniref:Uncharacterized protein n=1 Tax=Mycena citricolor TaxID=2018698 RepID=A0AAD2Q0R5_9AGAR|nr:unnamed protein product [Mycena citricolor]